MLPPVTPLPPQARFEYPHNFTSRAECVHSAVETMGTENGFVVIERAYLPQRYMGSDAPGGAFVTPRTKKRPYFRWAIATTDVEGTRAWLKKYAPGIKWSVSVEGAP